MKSSCGGIFYTYDPHGNLGVILGLEGSSWLPFKGCAKAGETLTDTAEREIFEESCGLIRVTGIKLKHKFNTKHKKYYIGLVRVPYDVIQDFRIKRRLETRDDYLEKTDIRFFNIDEIHNEPNIHKLTLNSIDFYWNRLMQLKEKGKKLNVCGRIRPRAVSVDIAKRNYLKTLTVVCRKYVKKNTIGNQFFARTMSSLDNWRRSSIVTN